MNWPLWVLLLVVVSAPILTLLADRAVDVPAPAVIRALGLPALLGLAGLVAWGWAADDPVIRVVGWGALGGLLGTAALDAVRLVGVKLRLFPLDMPMMFGLIALGLAPRMQRNVIAEMVSMLSRLPDQQREAMMRPRIEAISRLSPPVRRAVVTAMLDGLNRLPEDRREAVLGTQVSVLGDLPPDQRKRIMQTMDEAGDTAPAPAPYRQPRGLPKLPMETFRQFASRALPRTVADSPHTTFEVAFWGYLWHVLNGVSFGVMYTMLLGRGSWWLGFAWGGFVWLAMMVVMPRMMPVIRFPRWFPIWPAIAHLAMAAPIAAVALAWLSPADAQAGSLLGVFGYPG